MSSASRDPECVTCAGQDVIACAECDGDWCDWCGEGEPVEGAPLCSACLAAEACED